MKTLTFQILIRAPRSLIWDTMLADASYRQWTVPFCEDSYYEGNWQQGSRMRFLSPSGDGMAAVIAENRRPEFLSIKHLGIIRQGVESAEDETPSWAPAYENYTFTEAEGGTQLVVTVEIPDEFEDYLIKTWPIALDCLRVLAEAKSKR